MKYFILLGLFTLVSAQIDTTYVVCPPAGTNLDYEYSDYTYYPGDETSLAVISQPDWLVVVFGSLINGEISLSFSGVPSLPDQGLNSVVIGWYEWNYATGETELSQVFIFNIMVEESCCGDPMACNYNPDECITIGDYCLYDYECGCTDPGALNYDPQAQVDDWSCEYCYPGDLDDNGVIDVLDLIRIIWVLLSSTEPSYVEVCRVDVNADGALDISDLLTVVDLILNSTTQPEILSVGWGNAQPDCAGETEGWCFCESEFTATGTTASLININYCGESDVTLDGSISSDNWIFLQSHLSRPYFLALLDNYGSAGSNDSDYQWITVVFEDTSKTVEFTTPIQNWHQLDGLIQIRQYLSELSAPFSEEIHCVTPPDVGPCDGLCPRYFFNPETDQCELFYWGCCEGTVPFESLEECQQTCEE
ncbi:MAG: hypothetical protein GXO91_11150 [FCB group bacterium]|nr:hypothetical protein [FCB group bacterium]